MKIKYILIGLVLGYIASTSIDLKLNANTQYRETFPVGSKYNPMYVKIVK